MTLPRKRLMYLHYIDVFQLWLDLNLTQSCLLSLLADKFFKLDRVGRVSTSSTVRRMTTWGNLFMYSVTFDYILLFLHLLYFLKVFNYEAVRANEFKYDNYLILNLWAIYPTHYYIKSILITLKYQHFHIIEMDFSTANWC